MGYNPIGRWIGLLFEGMIAPDYDAGLNALAKVVASPAAPAPVQ
jgi:hypothetical protein